MLFNITGSNRPVRESVCVCLERAASRDAQRPLDHRVRGIEKGWSFALFKMPPNCNGSGMRAAGNRLGERVNAIKIRLKRLNRFGQSVRDGRS